ncbi:MAG: hypothetical protein NUV76_10230, partial [Candidatus Kuenenia sp.]|nr:hypothetical protein [Candidatus Kuenenia sp.]
GGTGILPVRNTGRNACTTLAINFIIHLPKTLFFDYIYKKSGMHPNKSKTYNNIKHEMRDTKDAFV